MLVEEVMGLGSVVWPLKIRYSCRIELWTCRVNSPERSNELQEPI